MNLTLTDILTILVLGSGAREHAICWKLKLQNPNLRIMCAPGNAGIAREFTCFPDVKATDIEAVLKLIEDQNVDFVVVGPEDPLATGIVDACMLHGIKICGPTQAAAELESSKSKAKRYLDMAGVPQAAYFIATDYRDAIEELDKFTLAHPYPVVIKDDELCAGKGVTICTDRFQALLALYKILATKAGKQGRSTVAVVEAFLVGQELSPIAFCDGRTATIIGDAQDCKPARPGGPMTGGMRTYSPVPFLTERDREQIQEIFNAVLKLMADLGHPYHGILFMGAILTPDGIKVLEFNVRFGDTECQSLLKRLESNLLELLWATTEPGALQGMNIQMSQNAVVSVAVCTEGYPDGKLKTGQVITGLEEAQAVCTVFHAGTKLNDAGELVNSGGRVFTCTAEGETIPQAAQLAYAGASKIKFEGAWYRENDIQGF